MKFYVPDHGEEKENARRCPIFRDGVTPDEGVAEILADWCYDHMDGWEWSWPVTMVLIGDSGESATFCVERYSVPEFTATEIKTGGGKAVAK